MGMADPESVVFIEVPGGTQPMLRVFGLRFRLIWVTLPKSGLRTVVMCSSSWAAKKSWWWRITPSSDQFAPLVV